MAKTAAERQREYRAKRRAGRNDEHQVNTWISETSYVALERIARYKQMTKRAVIERLILDADDRICSKLDDSKPEWDKYFGVE